MLASVGCGKYDGASCVEGQILLWDVATRGLLGPPLTSEGELWSIAFSPDGKTLAAGGCHGGLVGNACRGGRVVAWSLEGGTVRGAPRTLSRHEGNVLTIAISVDGRTLAAGDDQGSIALWDLERDRPLSERLQGHQGMIWSLCFSADGTVLASGNYNNTVTL